MLKDLRLRWKKVFKDQQDLIREGGNAMTYVANNTQTYIFI